MDKKRKLWDKGKAILPLLERFETGSDLVLDSNLARYDIIGSLAHAKMLNRIGIISDNELRSLFGGLRSALALKEAGKFELSFGDEDIHTKLENYLARRCGDAGYKIHTARSRNDQVLTALRLYLKDRMLCIRQKALDLSRIFLVFAKTYEFVPMPGYTHMQRAMPSSVGMWAESFSEALLDDLELVESAYAVNDQLPLGSAAGYGVPIKVDREYVRSLLGFSRIQRNSLYCQNSRGKIELAVVGALVAVMMDIARFASDVLIFTTKEFGFFDVSQNLLTGSSIMPQKNNVDIAELLRSKQGLMTGYYVQIADIAKGLPSGYNRDLQDIKKPLIEAVDLAESSLDVAILLVKGIKPNAGAMEAALTPEIFATHNAFKLVKQGVPFRKAYREVASHMEQIERPDLKRSLLQSSHIGATGNIGIPETRYKIGLLQKKLSRERTAFDSHLKKLEN
jgi:argininosuccinate lyase